MKSVKNGMIRKGSRMFRVADDFKPSQALKNKNLTDDSNDDLSHLSGIDSGKKSLMSSEMYHNWGIQMGQATILGSKHNTNEDRSCYDAFEFDGEAYCFAAVFDGHGGNKCSDFAKHSVGKYLRDGFCQENAWENGEEVMTKTFHDLDKDYCERALRLDDTSGACATVVVCKEDEAIVGNIGDCRAVLVPMTSSGSYLPPVEITVDHRADAISENLRINEAGGEVYNGRVGALQPSRSFGDIDVKLQEGKDVVIASPDVDRVQTTRFSKVKKKAKGKFATARGKITGGAQRSFMIIATDGVWDVLDNKEASNCVKQTLKPKNQKSFNILGSSRRDSKMSSANSIFSNDADVCADKLVRLALEKGSDDDITVVVILF